MTMIRSQSKLAWFYVFTDLEYLHRHEERRHLPSNYTFSLKFTDLIIFNIHRKIHNALINQFVIKSPGHLKLYCSVNNQFPKSS